MTREEGAVSFGLLSVRGASTPQDPFAKTALYDPDRNLSRTA